METSSNLRSLLGVLATRHPGVVVGDEFLDRALIAEGMHFSTSPATLRAMFSPLGDIEAAVVIRDGATGERVGLVVFSDLNGYSTAVSAPPLPVCYRRLHQANSLLLDPSLLANSIQDAQTRRAMAERLASTLPPSYLNADEDDFHLRCIFFQGNRGFCSHEDGALRAYHIARDVLSVPGNVTAVILCELTGVATVVFDEAADTEWVARRSSLLPQNGVRMYDSSLFPICTATSGVNVGGPMLRMLPAFCHHADYRGRVVIFKGLDTTGRHRDAGVIAESVQQRLGRPHRLQALLVHRSASLVVAVLGSRDEALALVQETQDFWVPAFGVEISCELMDAGQFPTDLRASAPEFVPHPDVIEEANSTVEKWILSFLRSRAAGDTRGLVIGLAAQIALFKPHIIMGFGEFADRAVLLVGVASTTTKSRLRSAMRPFGGFAGCSIFHEMEIALLVFKAASTARRVLSEPTQRWVGSGFSECQAAPGAEEACVVAELVLARRLQAVDWAHLSRSWADDQVQREACVRILELVDGEVSDLV